MSKQLETANVREGGLTVAGALRGDPQGRIMTALDPVTGQLQGWQAQVNEEAPTEEWVQPYTLNGVLTRHNESGTVNFKAAVPVGDGYSVFPGKTPPVTAALRAT